MIKIKNGRIDISSTNRYKRFCEIRRRRIVEEIATALLIAIMSVYLVISVGTLIGRANAQNYVEKNGVYKSAKTSTTVKDSTLTPYKWEDSKGNKYPIIIAPSGSCYIWRTSSKNGKLYKSYLGYDLSCDICRKMNHRLPNPTKKKK